MSTYKEIGKLLFAGILLAVLTIALGPVMPVQAAEPLAVVSESPTVIQIYNVSNKDLALTVSANTGAYAQTDIPVGDTFSFVLNDGKGPLPDGRYKYELMTIPQSDGEQLEAQTGSFSIVNGDIVPYVRPAR